MDVRDALDFLATAQCGAVFRLLFNAPGNVSNYDYIYCEQKFSELQETGTFLMDRSSTVYFVKTVNPIELLDRLTENVNVSFSGIRHHPINNGFSTALNYPTKYGRKRFYIEVNYDRATSMSFAFILAQRFAFDVQEQKQRILTFLMCLRRHGIPNVVTNMEVLRNSLPKTDFYWHFSYQPPEQCYPPTKKRKKT